MGLFEQVYFEELPRGFEFVAIENQFNGVRYHVDSGKFYCFLSTEIYALLHVYLPFISM